MPAGPLTPAHWRLIRRGALATFAVMTTLVAVAPPVAASGSIPTNFESVIDDIRPEPDGVEVTVVGGDAFLQVRAEPGVEVDIPGYDGEPYLRIESDGTVLRNERSAATFLNSTRDGTDGAALPDSVAADAEPEWIVVGSGGVVAWHDHRIHWMLADTPPLEEGEVVQVWMVPMEVDGTEVEVSGRLLYRSDQLPWAAAIVVLVAAGTWVASRTERLQRALGAGAAGVALVMSLVEYLSQPQGAAPSLIPVVVAGAAVASALAAGVVSAPNVRRALPLATVALLSGWFVGSVSTMWMPVLPGVVPDWAQRTLTAAVFGVALGIAASVLLAPPVASAADPRPDEAVQDSN